MNRPTWTWTTVLAGTLLGGAAAGQDAELPWYVGRAVCLECHAGDGAAAACSEPSSDRHRRAFAVLQRPEAEHIAALSGVLEAPHLSRLCLGCHATAADDGPRWTRETFDIADGVQCEACHGPGSDHADARLRRAAGAFAEPLTLLRPGPERCDECHWPKASHRIVIDEGFRTMPADRLYKTPVNLTVSPDGRELYVVCEHSNSLIVVDLPGRRVSAEIAVGLRPQDVAVHPGGQWLLVTNRLAATLSIIDRPTRRVLREVPVGAEPHGVLSSADGRLIVVLNTGEDTITLIDGTTLQVLRHVAAGGGPWSLARHPDESSFYVTSARPNPGRFQEPQASELTVIDATAGVVTRRLLANNANMLLGIDFVPQRQVALFTMMRTKHLLPITRLAQGWTITNGLGVVWPGGRVDQVLLDEPSAYFPDANDVAVAPDGRHALVTSGGSDRVAVVDVERLLSLLEEATAQERSEILPNHLGMSRHFVRRRLAVGTNPRAVCFTPDGRLACVANALDDTISVIDAGDFSVAGTIDLGGPREVSEIRRGERLFHRAANAFGRQFSCRGCHPDGHLNGLSFDIEADGIGMHPVDNRTLRGILDTGPFKWEGTNPSLERQCGPRLAVFFTRLDPFTPQEVRALVRYECTIERPPNRYREPRGLTPAQRRGKAVFERAVTNDGATLAPEERCSTCHNTPYGTARTRQAVGTTLWFDAPVEAADIDLFDVAEFGELGIFFFEDTGMVGEEMDVPHLNNVYMSAPFLHNGAAPTLEEIWTRFNMIDRHGYTRDLTRQQFNDLMAYLRAF